MAQVIWSRDALEKLDLILHYVRQHDAVAAARLNFRLVAAADTLSDFPNRGRPSLHGTRELPTVPPYILRYDVAGDIVSILDIRHGRQRPPEA